MSVHSLLFIEFKDQGWSEQTMLALCMEYIDNQQADGTFKDFLEYKTDAFNTPLEFPETDEEEIE